MKTKDKGQTAPRRKSKFKREEVSQNIWHYSDEHESAFVHECLWLWEVDISEVDNFLDGYKHAVTTDCHGHPKVGDAVVPSKEIFNALLKRRQDAFDAFKTGNTELMGAYLDALSGWCHFVGFRAAAGPEIAIAATYRKKQSGKRLDKPGSADNHDPDRNNRIRAFHARLVKSGARNANSQTAKEFDVSVSTVQRAINKGKNSN